MKLLSKEFYTRHDVLLIAEELVGKIIKTTINGAVTTARIVETEAYRGADDKGCHSFIHGITDRTAVMYEEGGIAYVYICYGMHNMINVVTNREGAADAVLIRAIEPMENKALMLTRRGKPFKSYHLSGGPGKVCTCLGIDKSLNGVDYTLKDSPIQIYTDGHRPSLVRTPRVGMSYRVADYANKPWRFYEEHNTYVSRPLQLRYDY